MNQLIKKILGPTYPLLMKFKSNKYTYASKKALAYLFFKYETRLSNYFKIDICNKIGLGAIMSYYIRIKCYALQNNLDIEIVSSCPLYSNLHEENFLARYFNQTFSIDGRRLISKAAAEWLFQSVLHFHPSLEHAKEIFRREFRSSSFLNDKTTEALSKIGSYEIAIHFRGTDKFLESGTIQYDKMFDAIDIYLAKSSTKSIFLATDDGGFRTSVKKRFADIEFFSYDLCKVCEGEPRHFSNSNPDDKALEAIVNIFLLSRAKYLIRTSSYLSGIAFIASENQITDTINWTNTSTFPFPEKTIFEIENLCSIDNIWKQAIKI